MTRQPITVFGDIKLEEALRLMEDRLHPLNVLPVLKRDGSLHGLFRLHDAYGRYHRKPRELYELGLCTKARKQEKMSIEYVSFPSKWQSIAHLL